MKSVLLSVQPKWVDKICHEIGERSGKPIYEKEDEVRKTRPNAPVPFKVYIYESRRRKKVVAEFICDRIDEYESEFVPDDECRECISRIDRSDYWDCDTATAEVIWDNENENPLLQYSITNFAKQSCIQYNELKKYIGIGINTFYVWHISDLKIYDKPKKLSEFNRPCDGNCQECKYALWQTHTFISESKIVGCTQKVTAPQSWCYVKEVQE